METRTFMDIIGNSWKVLRVLMSAAICAVLLLILVKEFVPSRDTYGLIYVDSPEIYTRERLVNDRFLQDAWLKNQLEPHRKVSAAYSYHQSQRTTNISSGKSEKNNASGLPENGAQSRAAALSTEDVFVDMVDFRDRVRGLKIENQLDDRHDLKGNTLYRLKFDATIIPGASTRALAKIEVKLTGPNFLGRSESTSDTTSKCRRPALKNLGSNEKIRSWREVYKRWLLNLQARLNQTHQEQKQVYYNNQFKKADYTRLKNFFETYYDFDLRPHKKGKPRECDDPIEENANNLGPYSIDHTAERKHIRCIVRQILRNGHPDNSANNITNREQKTVPHGEYQIAHPSPPVTHFPVAISKSNQEQDVPSGEYQTGLSAGPITEMAATTGPPALPVTERYLSEELDKHLNTFLAGKTLQLVLGIRIPQSKIVDENLSLPQLRPLSKISFFFSQLENSGYKVFTVEERIFDIIAINPKAKGFDIDHLKNLFENPSLDNFELSSITNPKSQDQENEKATNLHIRKEDLRLLREESYPVASCEFSEMESYPGVYVARAEVGLWNFVDLALDQAKTYVYAVTPKMRSENQFSSYGRADEVEGGIPLGIPWLKDLQVRLGRDAVTRTVNRKGTAVGFGMGGKEKEAVFGWVIGPRLLTADGKEKIHAPVQQSLSALVSLPSWWNKAHLTVTTNWIDRDGKTAQGPSSKKDYDLDLPTNFEQLEAEMLQVPQLGPELMESMLDPIRLTACEPGAIVIPGRRLWRSTVVTLGHQTADEISVLPNMKGIIARFYSVENQMSVSEEKGFSKENNSGIEIMRTVRVWTSQGTIALPEPARIGVTDSCRNKRAAKASKKDGEQI